MLDLILRTRLEIFEHAIDEVREIINTVHRHGEDFRGVDGFLAERGGLHQAEDELRELLGDSLTRLDTLVRRDGDAKAREVQELVTAASGVVKGLSGKRQHAYGSLGLVHSCSLSNLGGTVAVMQHTLDEYGRRIRAIRRAQAPWRRFREELPHRGRDLASCYVDLVACLALRVNERDFVDDRETMHALLSRPLDVDARGRAGRPPPALTGLLGHDHRPLGFGEWDLWTLPLMGFEAGLAVVSDLIRKELLGPADERRRVFYADAYAQYVLGPSYLYASVFLMFDPEPKPATPRPTPTDAERVGMLLDRLPELAPDILDRHSMVVKTAARSWDEARACFDAADGGPVSTADRTAVAAFYAILTGEFPEIGFDPQYVEDATAAGLLLVDYTGTGDPPLPNLRDLLVAMWLARAEAPCSAREIHRGAAMVARRTRESMQSSVTRTTQPRRL